MPSVSSLPVKKMDTTIETNVEIIQKLVLKFNPTLLLAFRNPPEKKILM